MFVSVIRAYLINALMFGLLSHAFGQSQKASSPTSPVTARSATRYGNLPLSFEANQGQAASGVRFVARGQGYTLSLTDSAAVLTLRTPVPTERSSSMPCESAFVRMELAGASTHPKIGGEERTGGTVNYFMGNDPTKWLSGIPTYRTVKYTGVYPGVDLVYYGNQRQLEYDFLVSPGADPNQVRMRFARSNSLRLSAEGELNVLTKRREIGFHKPVVYQLRKGRREEVEGRFVLLGRNMVGFGLGAYDHAEPLVIDPVLVYSTYLGGSNDSNFGGDYAASIAVDATGNAYITGQAESTDFPVTSDAYQTKNRADASQAFVSKFNPEGTALIYSTYFGGSVGEYGTGIAVDASGNAYITGKTMSGDFPVTPGAFRNAYRVNAGGSTFVTKFNASGTALIYSTYLGGSEYDISTGIALDTSGNAYITGNAMSTNFPVTTSGFQRVKHTTDGANAFITKLNAEGSKLVYSTYLGGSGNDHATSIAVSVSGIAYVTGITTSSDFPVSKGAFQSTLKAEPLYGGSNAFVTAVSASGSSLAYSSFLGGSGRDGASGITVDSSGNAYVTGFAYSDDFPVTLGAFQTVKGFDEIGYAFVTKVNPGGTALVYSTYLGGSDLALVHGDQGSAISVDQFGDAFVTGSAESSNFPVTEGALQTTVSDRQNAFLTALNPKGSELLYSTYLGGSQYDYGHAIAVDRTGDVFVAGETFSSDLPTTAGAFQTVNRGARNGDPSAFVARFAIGPTPATLIDPTPGSRLSNTEATKFAWTAGTDVTAYQLWLGATGAGSNNLYDSGSTTSLTKTAGPLPADGGTVFATLYSLIDGVWKSIHYTFTESGTAIAAVLTAPTGGSTLSDTATTTFTWTAGTGVTAYELRLGTTGPGSYNLYNSGSTRALTEKVGPLPGNGGTIYVTLYSLIDGSWKNNSSTFLESGSTMPPVLLTPAPGSTLTSANVTFTWSTGLGVTAYQLWLGTSGPGSHNLFDSGVTEATSAAVTELPLTGITIYATLYAEIDGVWKSSNYTYTASNAALLATAETIRYTFTGNSNGSTDGRNPDGGMLMDSQGNLYGTTANGGVGDSGTVFKLSPAGQETILHRFGSGNDGVYPYGGLVMDPDGNLYGTTWAGGGPETVCGGNLCGGSSGTVFKVTPAGTESILHSFRWPGTDGLAPADGLVLDASGNLYGTTSGGGNATGCGTVFEVMMPGGTETVRHSFSGPDGCYPGRGDVGGMSNGGPGLIMDPNKNLYGTTYAGGRYGYGTVFKLAPPYSTETVLHSFPASGNGSDGSGPFGGLALDSEGNLYGVTVNGGLFGSGAVFKVAPDGTESVLYNFSEIGISGLMPGLVLDNRQNLYGTSHLTAFELSPTGVLTILHTFPTLAASGSHDGSYPQGGLLITANGSLYGTTSSDPNFSSGTAFELSPSPDAVAAPVFSVLPGTYYSPQTITTSDATPGATIYYSLTGIAGTYTGSPIQTTFEYTGPLTISSTTPLSAYAVAPDGTASVPIQALYAINPTP